MKCPYRKQVENNEIGTEEHFMDCYKEECPLYSPEHSLMGGLVVSESCVRADKEWSCKE